MKLLILAFSLLVSGTMASHAQGTIRFATRLIEAGLDAPVSLYGLGGPGPGPIFSAAIYYEGMLIPGSITTFQESSAEPNLARYIVPKVVAIPGTEPGQQNVFIEARIWHNAFASYEAALSPQYRASSGPLMISELGGGSNPNPANHLPPTFTGFLTPGGIFLVPEPSPISLVLIGVLVLAFCARARSIRNRKNPLVRASLAR